MTAGAAAMPPGSAVLGCKRYGTGCWLSTPEGPAGLVNGKAPGNTPLLTAAHRQALLQIVESGPIPAVHGVVRWRLIALAQWVFEEFRISISKQTLSRELRALELRKLSARPRHHAQDAEATAAFKKTSPRASTRSPSATWRASR
jgi:transposase